MEDANTAESSPAVVAVPPEEWTGDQRDTWLKTGDTPTKEASAPSTESSGADDESDKPAPDSEPGKKQEPKKKGNVDSRIQELLDERHELRTRLEKLEKGDKQADPPPADKPGEKKEAKLERPKRPAKLAEWTGTYDEHEEAMDKYYQDLSKFEAREALAADRVEREKQSTEAQVQAENAKIMDSWKERVEAAKKDYADYAEVAFNKETPINATTDGFILKDKLGAKVLYQLGKDPAEAARIAALDPIDTMEALIEIKRSLGGTPSDKQAPEKKNPTTKAPPPPTELTGRNTEASDEAEAALKAGDFERYKRIMDRRDAKKE